MEGVWNPLIDGAFAVVIALLTWWSNRQDAADKRLHERLDEHHSKIEKVATEQAVMKERMDNFPDADDHAELRQLLNASNMQMAEIRGGQKILTDLLTSMMQDRQAPPPRRRSNG